MIRESVNERIRCQIGGEKEEDEEEEEEDKNGKCCKSVLPTHCQPHFSHKQLAHLVGSPLMSI